MLTVHLLNVSCPNSAPGQRGKEHENAHSDRTTNEASNTVVVYAHVVTIVGVRCHGSVQCCSSESNARKLGFLRPVVPSAGAMRTAVPIIGMGVGRAS